MPNAASWTFFLHCAGVQPETLRPRCWAVWAVYLCTAQAGYFLSKKSKKKFASSQAEKSGYNKKKLKLDFFWSCTGIFVQYRNIEIELNVVCSIFGKFRFFMKAIQNLIKSSTWFDVWTLDSKLKLSKIS